MHVSMVAIVSLTPTLTHLLLEKWTISIGIKEVGVAASHVKVSQSE
jgi:hypothetical protein